MKAVGCAGNFEADGVPEGVAAAEAKLAMLCSDDWLN